MAEGQSQGGEITIVHKDKQQKKSSGNPLLSLLSNLTQFFNFPPQKRDEVVKVESSKSSPSPSLSGSSVVSGDVVQESKPVAVRFPVTQPSFTPLKLEADEMEQDTNPVVLWQVYAIGGFFVLRWALARWKERRANKKPSNEDLSPPPPSDH